MTSMKQGVAKKERRLIAEEGAETPKAPLKICQDAKTNYEGVKAQITAKVCLNYGGITTEMWSSEIGVSIRQIQKWRSGEQEISEDRAKQIIFKSKELITKQRESIEREIDFWIIQTYGPNAKR